MSGNGQRRPSRPRIELNAPSATAEEAAAIAGAIEQFLRDTAPPSQPPGARPDPWLRAGLLEAAGRDPRGASPWGDSLRWGLTAE